MQISAWPIWCECQSLLMGWKAHKQQPHNHRTHSTKAQLAVSLLIAHIGLIINSLMIHKVVFTIEHTAAQTTAANSVTLTQTSAIFQTTSGAFFQNKWETILVTLWTNIISSSLQERGFSPGAETPTSAMSLQRKEAAQPPGVILVVCSGTSHLLLSTFLLNVSLCRKTTEIPSQMWSLSHVRGDWERIALQLPNKNIFGFILKRTAGISIQFGTSPVGFVVKMELTGDVPTAGLSPVALWSPILSFAHLWENVWQTCGNNVPQ